MTKKKVRETGREREREGEKKKKMKLQYRLHWQNVNLTHNM